LVPWLEAWGAQKGKLESSVNPPNPFETIDTYKGESIKTKEKGLIHG